MGSKIDKTPGGFTRNNKNAIDGGGGAAERVGGCRRGCCEREQERQERPAPARQVLALRAGPVQGVPPVPQDRGREAGRHRWRALLAVLVGQGLLARHRCRLPNVLGLPAQEGRRDRRDSRQIRALAR